MQAAAPDAVDVSRETAATQRVYGLDDDVETALLQFLLSIDLKKSVSAWDRPVDDPLRWRLADYRRMKVGESGDHLWVRLLDVERALEDVLGLRVSVEHRGAGGELRIRYRSLDQLDGLCRRLKEAAGR